MLNTFFDKYDKKVFLNNDINCCGFKKKEHPMNNIFYYLKKKKFIVNNNIDVFKEILKNNDTMFNKKIKVDFSKINNKLVKPHSPEFYQYVRASASKMKERRKDRIEKTSELPDINVSIFYTKDKKYSILNYIIIDENNFIEEKVVLMKKQEKKWIELETFNRIYP